MFLKNVGLDVALRKLLKIYLGKYEQYFLTYIFIKSDPLYLI